MARVPTPLPPVAVSATRNLLSGPVFRIVWKLILLIGGLGLLIWLASTTGSLLVTFTAGVALSLAASSALRKALMQIWNAKFYWINI